MPRPTNTLALLLATSAAVALLAATRTSAHSATTTTALCDMRSDDFSSQAFSDIEVVGAPTAVAKSSLTAARTRTDVAPATRAIHLTTASTELESIIPKHLRGRAKPLVAATNSVGDSSIPRISYKECLRIENMRSKQVRHEINSAEVAHQEAVAKYTKAKKWAPAIPAANITFTDLDSLSDLTRASSENALTPFTTAVPVPVAPANPLAVLNPAAPANPIVDTVEPAAPVAPANPMAEPVKLATPSSSTNQATGGISPFSLLLALGAATATYQGYTRGKEFLNWAGNALRETCFTALKTIGYALLFTGASALTLFGGTYLAPVGAVVLLGLGATLAYNNAVKPAIELSSAIAI